MTVCAAAAGACVHCLQASEMQTASEFGLESHTKVVAAAACLV